jgi:hypothetical protein
MTSFPSSSCNFRLEAVDILKYRSASHQPTTNLVKDERGDLLADHQQILTRWKNYFCQLLNIQLPGGIRQTEIHTAEPFVPEPSAAEV